MPDKKRHSRARDKTGISREYTLIVAVFILLAVGIVMVYSASSTIAGAKFDDSNYFLKRHIIRVLIGLGAMMIAARVNYHIFRKLSRAGLIAAFVLLVYVLFAGTGVAKGASRWLNLGGVTFQPSEFAKYALIFYMADALVRKRDKLGSFTDGYLPLLIILGGIAALILLEPDFSTAAVITFLVLMLFFAGAVRMRHICATGIAALPFFAMAVYTSPYRMKRFLSFLNPEADPLGAGYQIKQSLISLGSGGLFGLGIGQSKQKLLYLPEPHTDFIFAILGEELGFIGAVTVLTLFLVILWRGMVIAKNASDSYGRLLAAGITLCIVVPAFINTGVVCGALPATGMPMPFISYGGSSLLFTLTAVGILINISSRPLKGAVYSKRNLRG